MDKRKVLANLTQITSDPLGGPVPRIELTIDEKELSALSRLEVIITRPTKHKKLGVMGSFWKPSPITRHPYFISDAGKLYAPGEDDMARWQDGRAKKQYKSKANSPK